MAELYDRGYRKGQSDAVTEIATLTLELHAALANERKAHDAIAANDERHASTVAAVRARAEAAEAERDEAKRAYVTFAAAAMEAADASRKEVARLESLLADVNRQLCDHLGYARKIQPHEARLAFAQQAAATWKLLAKAWFRTRPTSARPAGTSGDST